MSKYINKKRNACIDAAIDLLKQTVYADNPDECSDCLWLDDIAVGFKQENLERYKKGLQVFKTLFSCKDESVQIALWNALTYFNTINDFDKEDFSNDEYSLIKKVVTMDRPRGFDFNANNPIVTERLILRPFKPNDFSHFRHYYKNDGDFEIYSGDHPTKENINNYALRPSPLLFAIEETTTHSLIGNIGFDIHDECNEVRMGYYIFKPFRHNGYCKEAATALIDNLFKHKLFIPVETIRKYTYKKKFVKIDTVRAMVATTNEASKKVVQSLGMAHEATLANRMRSADFNWVDEEIYVLTKNQ